MSILSEPLARRAAEEPPPRPAPREAGPGAGEGAPAQTEALDTRECGIPHGDDAGRLWVSVKVEEAVAAAVMAVLALLTLANVLSRYVVNVSLAFTEEYSIVLMLVLIFVGVSSAIAKNGHICVTFFLDRMRPRLRRRFEALGLLAMLACLGVLAFTSARATWSAAELGETSPGLGHPQWVYLVWVPVLTAVAMLRGLGALVRRLRRPVQE